MDTTRPASRILSLLEILQDRPGISGPELAERLDVSTRTVRRYIVTLQDMGIPVEPNRSIGWIRPATGISIAAHVRCR
ncbi:MAG: HTH domain-containing protein [Thermomicrobiales bacterium]|nr:HTH domain-containing protein [Thermomicrobiales bacterium]